jgi:signal transduction histidine kinase
MRRVPKILRSALAEIAEFLGARESCLAVWHSGPDRVETESVIPSGATWDPEFLAEALHSEEPFRPEGVLVAPLLRRGRKWALFAHRFPEDWVPTFEPRALSRAVRTVHGVIDRLDQLRLGEVLTRVDRKIMARVRPQDLFYEILHGLKSLTRYDHSSAVLIHDPRAGDLTLVAEQISWSKAKSKLVGLKLPFPEELRKAARSGEAWGFDREGDRWTEWRGRSVDGLAEVLDYNTGDRAGASPVRERSLLCAPLISRDGLLGLIKIAARHRGILGEAEAEFVQRFLPQAAFAITNLNRAENLELEVQAAHKQAAMSILARGVAHDINGALATIIPLVQQMIHELGEGEVEREVFLEDLGTVHESMQVCRRIFGGMLALAKSSARLVGGGNLRRAIDHVHAILKPAMDRRGIGVEVRIPEAMPTLRCAQDDLIQLILNLATNAMDAMPRGGVLSIEGEIGDEETLLLRVADTGVGIPPEILGRVLQPFFTTKEGGTGLGLSICRTIVTNVHGEIDIGSEPGAGTTVRIRLPILTEEPQ